MASQRCRQAQTVSRRCRRVFYFCELFFHRNKMSSNNQMESIEYLTKVVSTTLGLREQLDVIRIISPEATVSATDTEFFIGKLLILILLHRSVPLMNKQKNKYQLACNYRVHMFMKTAVFLLLITHLWVKYCFSIRD